MIEANDVIGNEEYIWQQRAWYEVPNCVLEHVSKDHHTELVVDQIGTRLTLVVIMLKHKGREEMLKRKKICYVSVIMSV